MTMHAGTSTPAATAWQQLRARYLSVETIREVDRIAIDRFGMHSLVLMENAALGCAQWLTSHFSPSQTLLLCGRGNNGGDGLAIARHLLLAGWPCRVVQLGPLDKLSQDARANWNILTAARTDHVHLIDDPQAATQLTLVSQLMDRSTIVIDALLGSGASGAPRSPMSNWIELANASQATRIAIDIPSGLDATTGQPALPTFRAHATLTFVAQKVGFAHPNARDYLGQVEVLPIGIPVELIEELLRTP